MFFLVSFSACKRKNHQQQKTDRKRGHSRFFFRRKRQRIRKVHPERGRITNVYRRTPLSILHSPFFCAVPCVTSSAPPSALSPLSALISLDIPTLNSDSCTSSSPLHRHVAFILFCVLCFLPPLAAVTDPVFTISLRRCQPRLSVFPLPRASSAPLRVRDILTPLPSPLPSLFLTLTPVSFSRAFSLFLGYTLGPCPRCLFGVFIPSPSTALVFPPLRSSSQLYSSCRPSLDSPHLCLCRSSSAHKRQNTNNPPPHTGQSIRTHAKTQKNGEEFFSIPFPVRLDPLLYLPDCAVRGAGSHTTSFFFPTRLSPVLGAPSTLSRDNSCGARLFPSPLPHR